MFWIPSAVASCPVTGICSSLRALSAEIAALAEPVVGGEDAVDLVVGLLEHLLEDGQRLLVVPLGHGLVGRLGVLPGLELRLQDEL
jgi:hypothetical protein